MAIPPPSAPIPIPRHLTASAHYSCSILVPCQSDDAIPPQAEGSTNEEKQAIVTSTSTQVPDPYLHSQLTVSTKVTPPSSPLDKNQSLEQTEKELSAVRASLDCFQFSRNEAPDDIDLTQAFKTVEKITESPSGFDLFCLEIYNRYRDIKAFGHSLPVCNPNSSSDPQLLKINASVTSDKTAILTQCPCYEPGTPCISESRANSTNYFWKMVWTYKVPFIFMLVNENEGQIKFTQYWPTTPMDFIDINISLTSEEYFKVKSDKPEEEEKVLFTKRIFTLIKDEQTHQVIQFALKCWRDQDIPTIEDLTTFIKALPPDALRPTPQAPNIYHCSAGVGRAGTFAAIIKHLFDEKETINLAHTMLELRRIRAETIQSAAQLTFAAKFLLNWFAKKPPKD